MSQSCIHENIRQGSWNLINLNAVILVIVTAFGLLIAASKNPIPRSLGEWLVILIGASLGLLAIRNILLGCSRLNDHKKHPLWKLLSFWGRPEDVQQELDRAIEENSGLWHFEQRFLCPSVCRLDDLIWIYAVRTKHSVNFVPTGTSMSVNFHDRHGQSFTVSVLTDGIEGTIRRLSEQSPWAIVGHSTEVEEKWNSDRASLIAEVDESRRTLAASREQLPFDSRLNKHMEKGAKDAPASQRRARAEERDSP